ncbi:MAG: ABC transporter ATP-binding protein/permease [Bacilli bacterium]|nr:ABC transporter ATP-binding protein/permease [Bacilli bacterium]
MRKALTPLKKYTVKVVLAPIFKIFECATELLIPFIVKDLINSLPGVSAKEILIKASIILGLGVGGFAVTMFTQYIAARVSADYAYDLKKDIYDQLGRISKKQLDKFGTSKALTLINNDSFSLQTGVNMFMRLFVRAPALLIGTVLMAFIVTGKPIAGLIVLGVLLLSSIVIAMVLLITPKRYKAIQEELDRISTIGEDSLSGARVIRAFNKQEDESKRFTESSSSYRHKALVLARINAFINPLTFAFTSLGTFFVLYLASSANPELNVTVGDAVAIISYMATALAVLVMFTRLITSLSKAYASKKRVDEFLSIEPDIVDGDIGECTFQSLKMKGVSVSFGGEEYALRDIDFEINKGESVGIIGGTGSGKTTILNLLERFFDPDEGEILLNDKPLKDYKLDAFRSQIALVSQKPQINKGSVKENISMGNGASEQTIEQALKDSLAYEFVSRYEDYLDHPLEENGNNLSGGQRQRILIARALAQNRDVLILDDSTSALDYKSDLLLRENISKKRGITTIFVSQRATSIKNCDRIYVLDGGKVVAKGTHEQLLETCDIYREIYQTQVAVR